MPSLWSFFVSLANALNVPSEGASMEAADAAEEVAMQLRSVGASSNTGRICHVPAGETVLQALRGGGDNALDAPDGSDEPSECCACECRRVQCAPARGCPRALCKAARLTLRMRSAGGSGARD